MAGPTNLEIQLQLEEKINDLRTRRTALSDEENQRLIIFENALEKINEKIANSLDLQQKRIDSIIREKDILTELYDSYSKKTESEKEAKDIKLKELEIQQKQYEFEKEIAEKKAEGVELSADTIAQQRFLLQQEQQELEILKQQKNATDGIAKTVAEKFGLKAQKGSIFDLITSEDGSIELKEESLVSFGKKFEQEYLNPQKIGASILQQVYEATYEGVIALDNQRAALSKATGAISGYVYELNSAANAVAYNGVSSEAAGNAMISLAKNFSYFNETSSRTKIELASTIANLSALGISADTAAKNMSTLIQSFGMSEEQAMQTSRELAVMANVLGTSPERIASDFAAAASTIVVYGEKGIEVFRGLEAAAKASGLEVSALLGVVKKMDTFQGAAEAAGKLNAVLGGGLLNSSQLLVATEEERIRLVVESVQSQGVQFKDLDKYTQMSIANAAGITDMAQANKLFGMSLSEYDKYTIQAQKSKEQTERFDLMVQSASSSLDKLKVASQQLAFGLVPLVFIFSSLIDGFVLGISSINFLIETIKAGISYVGDFLNKFEIMRKVFNFFSEYFPVIDILAGAFKYLAMTIGFVVGVLVIARAASIAYNAVLFISQLSTNGVAVALYARTLAERILGAQLMATRIGQLLATGATIAGTAATMLFSIATYTAAGAVALLASPVTLVVLGIIALGAVVYAAIKNFDTWGRTLLFVLGPIGWIVLGLKALYDWFHKSGSPMLYEIPKYMAMAFEILGNVMQSIPSIMDKIAESMGKMATSTFRLFYAIAGLAGTLPLFALGLISAVPAMLAFAGASFVMNVAGGNYLEKILSAITPQRSAGLKVVVNSLDDLNKIHKEIKPESLKNVKELVDEVERYNFQLVASSALNLVSPLESLVKAVGGLVGDKSSAGGGDLILKVDGREIGRVAISAINASGGGNVVVKSSTPAGTRS